MMMMNPVRFEILSSSFRVGDHRAPREVCIQAGLPPNMDGALYPSLCRAIKAELPDIHIHGFSPEEVRYGAARAGVPIRQCALMMPHPPASLRRC
jgi:2-iminoacetate synthase ThiH